MGRRRKSKSKGGSMYLDPAYEELNEALVQSSKRRKGKNVPITLPSQFKSGKPSTPGAYQGSYSGPSYAKGWGTHEMHTHDGLSVVYEWDGKKLYAGNGRGIDEASGFWNLIIDCASQLPYHDPYGCVRARSADRFSVLRQHMVVPKKVQSEILSLDWPDMGVLAVYTDFWLNLWEMLPEKTLAICMGGHGRTGTCLAALMIASGVDYYTAIETVREKHCDRAIETVAQTRYLHALYMEVLKRLIVAEQDPKDQAELEKDLAYAKEHVPNTYSDYGEKEPPKVEKPKEAAAKDTSFDDGGTCLKLINGQYFEKACVSTSCTAPVCSVPSHMGWVEYDIEKEMDYSAQ